MKPSLIHVCSTCNPARRRKSVSGTVAQCRDTLNGTPLNGETRARYDIEAERLESSLYLFALCCLSVGLVVGIGIGRSIGIWK